MDLIDFAAPSKKITPPTKQGRSLIAVPLCFRIGLAAETLLGFKSLSDVTVAPVVPTFVSIHCSRNELHQILAAASHHPAVL